MVNPEYKGIHTSLPQKKYSIEEIRNYLLKQDSRGDIMYNLSEKSIDAANQEVKNAHTEMDEEDQVQELEDEMVKQAENFNY